MDELLLTIVSNAPTVAALLYLVYRQQNDLRRQQDRIYSLLEAVLRDDFDFMGTIEQEGPEDKP